MLGALKSIVSARSLVPWAWRSSKFVFSDPKLRAKFVLSAARHWDAANKLRNADASSPLGRLMSKDPTVVGNLVWPYQCVAWAPAKQFERITEHLEVIDLIPGLDLATDNK